jgi:hypothetical protein
MNVQLCKSCGNAFDLDEFEDGYCDTCMPDAGESTTWTEPWPEAVSRLQNITINNIGIEIPEGLSREEKRQLILAVSNGDCV